MKPIILWSILLLVGCSKKNSSLPPVVTYGYGASSTTISGTYAYFDFTLQQPAQLGGSSYGGYDGETYFIEFMEQSGPTAYGVHILLPADSLPSNKFPLNRAINFRLTNPYYSSLLNQCAYFESETLVITAVDSADITIMVTRNSGGTIDGQFSLSYYGLASYIQVSNGQFKNIPITQ